MRPFFTPLRPHPTPHPHPGCPCSLTCRYAKFRKLGQFEEWVVRGADWRNTRTARGAAPGVHTPAGTWALNEAEAAHIAASVDADEAWDRAMEGKADWTNRPVQPPGLGRCVGGAFSLVFWVARGAVRTPVS
jgi:hypothetical protein